MNREEIKALRGGNFGLEKESLRVNVYDNRLSSTDHPFEGDANISKDFCENQVEIITPVCESTDALYETLGNIDDHVKEVLDRQGEKLWNSSNPPRVVNESEIRIAKFEGKDKEKEQYREYLKNRYGVWRMLLSGIHYNFSFDHNAEEYLTGRFGLDKDALYLKLAKYSMKYAWLITYLTAASPVADPSYKGEIVPAASLRCSKAGYWNDFIPILDYNSVNGYVESIKSLVSDGRIYSPWELYIPVRLKPVGANTLDNLKKGISHIELRMIDINPMDEHGIAKDDLEFLHLLMMYLATREDFAFEQMAQEAAVVNMQRATSLDINSVWIDEPGRLYLPIKDAALEMLADMELFYEPWQDKKIMRMLACQKRKILKTNGRYSDRIIEQCANYSDLQAITA